MNSNNSPDAAKMKITTEWTFLAQPERGGHHFHRDENTRHLAIVGEEGTLKFDTTRPAVIGTSSGNIVVSFPLLPDNDPRECWTYITLKELTWLLDEQLWSPTNIKVQYELQPFVTLLKRLSL